MFKLSPTIGLVTRCTWQKLIQGSGRFDRLFNSSASVHCSSTDSPKPLGKDGLEKMKKRVPITKVKIDFYYDTISPYSWLAFEILQRYQSIWKADITYKPIFLGGLTKTVKNRYLESLVDNPNKAKYLFQDVERSAKYFQVPLRLPESPYYLLGVVGSLKQQRFLTAVKLNHTTEDLINVSRALWYRMWSEDMDAVKPGSLMIVGRRAGLSEEEVIKCIEAMETDAIKIELQNVTGEAARDGAYGLPHLVVHLGNEKVETFFGSDRFEVMSDLIGQTWEGPVPKSIDFKPMEMAPDPSQADIQQILLDMEAITINNEKF